MSTKNTKKKLAAIMFTHLVEYDEYKKEDEKLSVELLKEHDKVLSKVIEKYNGRIVKHMDNKIFGEFVSATDAVRCSINIHNTLKKVNSQNPDTFQMNVRIGIHMGEVYEKKGDLFGEGVNLAARIEPLAKYGGTVTTQAVYNSIRSEKDIHVRDMGRVLLKNIKEPERVFKIYIDKIEKSKETADELTEKLIKKGVQLFDKVKKEKKVLSISVLYLKNLGSEENEFFCYGLTEDLIISLSKLGEIKIPLINQILKHKDSGDDDLMKENPFKSDYIITGNIMKMGDSFRISLQFYNTNTKRIIWTESWESTSDVVQGLINKIAYKMLDSVNAEIPQSLLDSLKNEKKISPEAYEMFLKAKYLNNTSKNKVDKQLVIDLFKRAIKMDRNFIEPRWHYAGALLYNNEHERAVDVLDDALVIAKKNKDKSSVAGIKNAYGIIYQNWGRYEQSIHNFEEALEIRAEEKNLQEEAKVLNGIGQNYVALNNFEKSFECYNRSLDIKRKLDDKNGIAISLANMSINYRRSGDYSKAIEYSKEAMELFDDLNNVLFKFRMKMNLGLFQVIVGHIDDASKNLNESLDFLLQIDDFKSVGMCYRGIGLVELNKENWKKAQDSFKKALNFHQKAEHRPAYEGTTLFLGLSYYYNDDFELSEKFINKSVQITSMRKNISFYGNTAIAAQFMLNSKINKCTEEELDKFVNKLEKDVIDDSNESHESGWISREYWYISESYLNLNINEKADKYRKKSKDHLDGIALFISDEKIRKDYVELPLIHQLINNKKIVSENKEENKITKKPDDSLEANNDKSSNIFAFCPGCGFNNSNQFKFCPQCGTSLAPN